MAKVKIQGNASGTGVLTVTAPNTSTDRTITLPDGTGTLIADDGSGNVGIGMTPTQKLEVNGGIALPTTQLLRWNNSGTIAGAIGVDNSNNMILYNTEYNTERMRILSSGGITFNGDTAAANALDDYEEGTWTPAFGNVSISSYDYQVGHYTKIGDTVFFQMDIETTAMDTADTSSINIGGLPFTTKNTSSVPFTTHVFKGVNASHPMAIGWNNATYMLVYNFSAGTGDTGSQIQYSSCGSTVRIYVEGHYKI
jgi:hypothetical protein